MQPRRGYEGGGGGFASPRWGARNHEPTLGLLDPNPQTAQTFPQGAFLGASSKTLNLPSCKGQSSPQARMNVALFWVPYSGIKELQKKAEHEVPNKGKAGGVRVRKTFLQAVHADVSLSLRVPSGYLCPKCPIF